MLQKLILVLKFILHDYLLFIEGFSIRFIRSSTVENGNLLLLSQIIYFFIIKFK
jgi:hypothetical protein